ncbi:hypothetical protein BKA69DRAFT_721956 [Paraphysoderma sedebokerense]|nr:hypothetical protein BKA69DRAFT_721956 [Paraphysoderma sedebokerense]
MASFNSPPISSTATPTQSSPTASPSVIEDAWCHPIQLLIIGHEVLGARKLCMELDGVLVKRIVKELKALLKSRLKPNPAYVVTSELVQCYHCLYRVDITLDCAVPHDHSTKRAPFTLDVASDMFALIAAFAEDKLSKNQALKTDLKERLDDIKNRLGEPPLGNAYLATITSLVRRYLDTRLSDLLDAVFPADSPTMASRNEINEIHFRIHYVQARNLLIPFKSKFKTPTSQNASKMKDEIELIIEKFEENIYYNPKSFEGWWQLGLTSISLLLSILPNSSVEVRQNT